jgi:mono/diheme cytochrome c family protein
MRPLEQRGEDFEMPVRWSQLRSIIVPIGCGGLLFFCEGAIHDFSLAPISSSAASSQGATAPPAQVPPNLETPDAVQSGARLFRENCVQCHGAPGVPPVVQGLKPAPPNLLAAGRRNDPAEVFLKVTNGIAGTAMPAFGNILSDESRRRLAAFLHHSRAISAGAFEALGKSKAETGLESH